ncbi:hypothetical protein L1049_006930 [Liquidambar formosana]|uniref:Uncharacterized protein n=1 Tax=Liquidambar formosana TaxID=63359 RepID=A0AAP0WRL8_LIQFO
MTNKARGKKKSLCQKSIELVVNIFKLSSLSFANKSFETPARLQVADENHVSKTRTGSMPQILDSLSQEPERSLKLYPYPIPVEDGSSSMIPKINDVDGRASDYIRRFYEKYQNDSSAASKGFTSMLPSPTTLAKQPS